MVRRKVTLWSGVLFLKRLFVTAGRLAIVHMRNFTLLLGPRMRWEVGSRVVDRLRGVHC